MKETQAAGCSKPSNQCTKLPVRNFKDYIDLYIKENSGGAGNSLKVCYESPNDRWEVAVTLSDKGFKHISFVNSIATTKRGTHVDYVLNMIVEKVMERIKNKKNKSGMNITKECIKNNMWIFINCLIENPTFDSESKKTMTLQFENLESTCALSDDFILSIVKLFLSKLAKSDLSKLDGSKVPRLVGISKLDDAYDAGTENSMSCTLILTEGDSSKTFAVCGLGIIGRDKYGVFPLTGKLLNVRNATDRQIFENVHIRNIVAILGLKFYTNYSTEDDLKTLRYGKLMIMVDPDEDGSHIKGLIINFIHTFWPKLLQLNFVEAFITPIVKARKDGQEFSFFSVQEYEKWKKDTTDSHTFEIKYYKGLGSIPSKEATEYFRNMERHRICFTYDGKADDEAIRMAFSKNSIKQRKDWLIKRMKEGNKSKDSTPLVFDNSSSE